jgi:hypothetical protein
MRDSNFATVQPVVASAMTTPVRFKASQHGACIHPDHDLARLRSSQFRRASQERYTTHVHINDVSMMAQMDSEHRAYKPGQMVPISGVYIVVHELHRAQHEVLAIRGEEFPHCRVCRDGVRFLPTKVTTYVNHDFDLAGPEFVVRKGKGRAAAS